MASIKVASTLLAYQPIYDRSSNIAGGELLYRNDNGLSALDVGEDYATSEVIFNLCTGITEQFEGFQYPLFINVSQEFILSQAFLPLDPSKVVIELVERIEPDEATVRAIQRWHNKGFRFALDDFEYSPAWDPLIRLSDIIKIDIEATSESHCLKLREKLASYPLQWLAERVETQEQLTRYKQIGFDYFQGYFLARPTPIVGQKVTPAAAGLGRIIKTLFVDEVNIDALARDIAADPVMSVKLLKVANSPFYRGQSEISTLQQALLRLGLEELKKWVVLIASLEGSPSGTVHNILTRASTCAELAKAQPSFGCGRDEAFLAGLLSGVDMLLNVEREDFIAQLHVSEAVKAAALTQRGKLGGLVSLVLGVERGAQQRGSVSTVSRKALEVYHQQSVITAQLMSELG